MEIHQLPISQHHRHHSYLHQNHLNHFNSSSFADSFDKSHHQTSLTYNCPLDSELIDINSNTSNPVTLNNIIRFDQIKTEKNTILLNSTKTNTLIEGKATDIVNTNQNNLIKKYEEDRNICGSAFIGNF